MKNLTMILLMLSTYLASAQDTIALDPIVISANKISEKKSDVVQPVSIFTKKQILQSQQSQLGDFLQSTGTMLVQKSQQGGSSPVIRGFEANRVMITVDGVRMNNLIFRGGHLQNVITVDQNAIENLEVLFGPSSVMYGTDALGGSINILTKNPTFSNEIGKIKLDIGAGAKYSTANKGTMGTLQLNVAGTKLGYFGSFTYNKYDDLTMGTKSQTLDTLWGLRNYYVERINGVDSLVKNEDPYLQKFSGYNQTDMLHKLIFKQNDKLSQSLNIQYSTSSDVPRYDRLTDIGNNGKLKTAQWYYGPQKRILGIYSIGYTFDKTWLKSAKLNLSYQDVQESRNTRNFGAANLTKRVEKVNAIGLNIDLNGTILGQEFRYGIEYFTNKVISTAKAQNVNTLVEVPASTRYPDGDNSMSHLSVYATGTKRFSDKFLLTEGLRFSSISLNSTFIDKSFFPFPFNEAKQNASNLNGNIGLSYKPLKALELKGMISTGFKVPNVDDMSKVFESAKGALIVPNPNLKPEKSLNFDFGVNIQSGGFKIENSLFFTDLKDALVVDKFQLDGLDSVDYLGTKSKVLATQNKNKANVMGISSTLSYSLSSGLSFNAIVNYTKGTVTRFDNTESPLDHIPPVFGKIGVEYNKEKYYAQFFVLYNGWKRIGDYLLNAEDNEAYATKDGMPAWYTFNIRGGYNINEKLKVNISVENIMDVQYRVFASGIHAPGRNICLGVHYGL
jgi:hemoglobin/transferrin/lactoferrin receptor protein